MVLVQVENHMHMVELFTVLYNFIPISKTLNGRERWSLLRRL